MTGRDESPAGRASEHPSVVKYAEHVNPAFMKLLGLLRYGRAMTHARGVWITDHQGTEYLDALACFGAANLGHNHPRLRERLVRFLSEDHLNFVHVGPSVHQGELAEKLTALAGGDLTIAMVTNTGAEAVETGMKLARGATRRRPFIYCEGSYHGGSLGTLSIMGDARMRSIFEPLLGECYGVPFGDLDALEQALKRHKAAGFVIDPGLCEMGRMVPPPGYLAAAQALCRKYGTLMVLDEVQTGMGRTWALFSYQHEGFTPDIVAIAKSLSGGLIPVGAALTTAKIQKQAFGAMENFDAYFSTFGGNSLACTAASETLDILQEEGLIANSAALGATMLASLQERLAGHPLVREVRGRGLFIGIELGPTDTGWMNKLAPGLVKGVSKSMFGQWACVKLLERQIICQPATHNWNVIKLMPPLTLQPAEAERLVDTVVEVLGEYQGIAPLIKDVTGRLGQQFMGGWAF